MPPLAYLLLTLALASLSCACVIAERKIAPLYADHTLIRLSGFFAALALVMAGVWVWGVV